MRVKRGLRKTLCLQIEGVSKRYDRAYMGNEMTALVRLLFKCDLIVYTESGVSVNQRVCAGRRGVDSRLKQELFSLTSSLIGCRAHPVLCPVDTACSFRSV